MAILEKNEVLLLGHTYSYRNVSQDSKIDDEVDLFNIEDLINRLQVCLMGAV